MVAASKTARPPTPTVVDVTEWAHERGFSEPVRVTGAVWERLQPTRFSNQDLRGRALCLLTLAKFAVDAMRAENAEGTTFRGRFGSRVFAMCRVTIDDDGTLLIGIAR